MNDIFSNMLYQYGNSFLDSSVDRNNRTERKNLYPISQNQIKYDLVEDEKNIHLYFEIPGVLKNDIKIDIFNNRLKLTINKEQQYQRPLVSEIKYGTFSRNVDLSLCITKKETVKTNYINGILHILIEKFIEQENAFSINGNEIPETEL
jgi:HSP20 family molecular chaperone IbpA